LEEDMDIKEFGNALIKELENNFGEGFELKFNEVLKNNGVVYHAITIHDKNENVAPTIYIDDLLDRYLRGESLTRLAADMTRFYRECSCHKEVDIDFFSAFSEVCPKLSFRLACIETNKKRLQNVPYRTFEDLALVPICVLDISDCGQGSITITRKHLENWEVSEEELWDNIMGNVEKVFPPKVTPISDIINMDLFPVECFSQLENIKVISNEGRLFGANVAFYPGVLKAVAEKADSDLYVIPSSVHEMMVFPIKGCLLPTSVMVDMVRDVNTTSLSREEVLSFKVYRYDRDQDKLSACG
jgi:hypothetical protein